MDALQTAIYHLIVTYVERQRLPFEVIQKFRPHLVDPTKRRIIDKEYLKATQIGRWGEGNEWNYYLHGGGCRLTHTITGEVIDWDASNLKHFDPYWFVDWLNWFLTHNPTDRNAQIILMVVNEKGDQFRTRIFEILRQIHEVGRLYYYPDRTSKYELVTETI